MISDRRKAKLDRLIEDSTVIVPDYGKVLWVNRLYNQKSTLLKVYGPTLLDVERNLGVFCAYERTTPEIYNTDELYETIIKSGGIDKLAKVLSTHKKGSFERFYECYRVMFGIKRVTLTQITEITEKIRTEEGVNVPTRMSWYFKFQGFSNFYPLYLNYLGSYKEKPIETEDDKEFINPELANPDDDGIESIYEF